MASGVRWGARGMPRRSSNVAPLVVMGTLFASLPVAVGFVKGFEKRNLWKPAPAIVEEVTPDTVTYVYTAFDKVFRHSQRLEAHQKGRNAHFTVGDRVFVNVNTRNEELSVLEPPLLQPVWRDGFATDMYRGKKIQ